MMARQMKDSGVEWIGMIPEDWNLLPLGNCFEERNEKVSDYDWKPLSVTKLGIVIQLEKAAKSDAHDARKKVCKGDFVINSRSDRKQSCGISIYDGSVSLINIVLSSRLLDIKYVKYLLKNYGFAEEFYRWGTGIVADLWSTKYERMKKIMLPIPDKCEQQRIADFLNEKVGEIDSVIANTKETIEDYKKYKQAIITETVTKGLNPKSTLKKCPIEWLKQIPKDWNISKIKYIAELNPKTDISFLFEKTEVTFTPMDKIKNGFYINNTEILGKNNTSYNIYQENDIVMAKVTPCFENGNIAIMKNLCNRIGYGSSELFVIRANSLVNTEYLFYYLQNNFFKGLAQSTMMGAGGLKRVSGEFIRNHIMPLPSIEEQKEIAEYLDVKCSEIDKLIVKKEELLTDIESYKKSLIYEYVTGKKEVQKKVIIPFPATVVCKGKRFAQAVLLTKILDEFGDCHSGRVKVAKTLYVIENHIGFDFDTDVIRQVAGPLDEKYYKAEAIIKHNNWFNVLTQDGTTRYFAQKNKNQYLTYYNRYFKEYDIEIQRIIDIFKNLDMNGAELLATAYASWNDFIIKGISFTQDDIVEDIFSWDDSKKRFSKEKWIEALNDLHKKKLSPIGHGKMTVLEKHS